MTDTPISRRTIGSVPLSLPNSPGSIVTTSFHSWPSPLEMCTIICRLVVDEEHGDLRRQVDLDVVARRLALGVPAVRLDADRSLHVLPQLVGEDARGLVAGHVEDELLVGPQSLLEEPAELAVDLADEETELGEALLNLADLAAGHAQAERL